MADDKDDDKKQKYSTPGDPRFNAWYAQKRRKNRKPLEE